MAMENRGSQHHKARLAGALRDEISVLLEGGLSDPRIGLVTLKDLVMGAGNQLLRVYVAIEGTPEEVKRSLTALNEAAGFIRHELSVSLERRRVPEMQFVLDTSEMATGRVEELLKRAKKQAKVK